MIVRRWIAVALLVVLASCSQGDSPQVARYKAQFVDLQRSMTSAVSDWHACGSSPAACRVALNEIDVRTTAFGALYDDFSRQSLGQVTLPDCLKPADAHVVQAMQLYRHATSTAFDAVDHGLGSTPFVSSQIDAATTQLKEAASLLNGSHC